MHRGSGQIVEEASFDALDLVELDAALEHLTHVERAAGGAQ